jgi:hypothetical protein
MQIRAPIALQAIIKSMTDVVLPALDADNQLAQEQGHLIVGLLTLMAQRLPLQYAYDVDELRRICELGEKLQTIDADAQVAVALAEATAVLARVSADPAELIAVIGTLGATIGSKVQSLAAKRDASSRAACRAVLAASREQQLRERSWLLMQGWEADRGAVPPIEELLDLPAVAVQS